MALQTNADNVALTNAWTEIATGVAQITVQLLSVYPVVISIGAAAPAANKSGGHVLQSDAGRDAFSVAGLAGEKVYARSLRTGEGAVVAVTKG